MAPGTGIIRGAGWAMPDMPRGRENEVRDGLSDRLLKMAEAVADEWPDLSLAAALSAFDDAKNRFMVERMDPPPLPGDVAVGARSPEDDDDDEDDEDEDEDAGDEWKKPGEG